MMPMSDRICVVGLGYLGLPLASLFAKCGFEVMGIDIDDKKILSLQKKEVYLSEPGIKEIVKEALNEGKLKAAKDMSKADVFIIAVPTLVSKEGKDVELKYVKAAAIDVAKVLSRDNLVIIASTVHPKSTKNVIIPLLEESGMKVGKDFLVACSPERARPGNMMHELVNNDRVIGGIDLASAQKAKELYANFVKGQIYTTDITTAESIKLMENTFRDVNVALANEFAKLSEEIGIDAWEAIELANKNPLVKIAEPGPGTGGSSLPVDPAFLREGTKHNELITAARKINLSMPEYIVDMVSGLIKRIKNPTVTVLGLAYKANVDDLRGSPGIQIISLAKEKGWKIKANDPRAKHPEMESYELKDALKGSDCLVLVVDHDEYMDIDESILEGMRTRNAVDCRNALNHALMHNMGFKIRILGNKKND